MMSIRNQRFGGLYTGFSSRGVLLLLSTIRFKNWRRSFRRRALCWLTRITGSGVASSLRGRLRSVRSRLPYGCSGKRSARGSILQRDAQGPFGLQNRRRRTRAGRAAHGTGVLEPELLSDIASLKP